MSTFIYEVRRRNALAETRQQNEGLHGKQSSGDRAESVLYNTDLIAKNKKMLAGKGLNPREVAKARETIHNCTATIKNALVMLGAEDKVVKEIITYVDKNDTEMIRYKLLQLLAKRNPGMYERKLAVAAIGIKHR